MPFELPSGIPNFNTNIPQMTPPLETYGKMLQLKNLQGEQQMIPLQVQAEQQKLQSNDLAIQEQQQKLASRQAMVKAWSDPDFASSVTGSTGKDIAPAIGFEPGFDPKGMIRTLVGKYKVMPEDAMAQAASFLELSKNLSLKTKDDISNYKTAHEELSKLLTPIPDMKASEAVSALAAAKQQATKIPGLDPSDVQNLQQADLEHLPGLIHMLGFAGDVADFHKKTAEATKAAQESVNATPEGMAARTTAEEKAKIAVEGSPEGLELARKKTELEANARQQAAQGDPSVAGKLLADGSLTLADLKTRGTTPQFIEKATLAAQKVNPHYNPADEVIAESVAKSQTANQFFGSANSLIAKGGTLDQLEELGKKIPQHDWPVLNTVDDWKKLKTGKGPLAGYAAMVLGAADDYGKVMGGGTASDSARDKALDLFAQAASPEQRASAVSATRGAVQSQRDARIGKNQFLKRQYGAETGGKAAAGDGAGGTGKTLSMSAIQQAAKDHNVSVDEAKRQAKAAGYTIQ